MGTTQPFSVSPVLNVLKSDGQTYSSTVLNDPSTNAPFDTNAFDVMISPDGTKAVATILTKAAYEDELPWVYDLVIATADAPRQMRLDHHKMLQHSERVDRLAIAPPGSHTISKKPDLDLSFAFLKE